MTSRRSENSRANGRSRSFGFVVLSPSLRSRVNCAKDLLVLLLFLTLSAASMPASAQKNTAEQTLYKLENDFASAVVKRDANALRRIVAPKWVYSDESGVMERDAGIKAFTSGTDTVREATNEKMRALVYGNSAVVVGILQLKGTGAKGPFTNRYRYTDAWALIDGRWQCIASQDYLLPATRR